MHAGITAITELAVESGLTNRLPPGQRETIFFLAPSPLPKRRQFGFPWALQPPFSEHVSVWATSLAIRRLKQPANPPGVSRKTLRRLEYRLALEQSLRETLRLSYDACPNSSRRKMPARDTALKPLQDDPRSLLAERPTADKTTVMRRRKAVRCACGGKLTAFRELESAAY